MCANGLHNYIIFIEKLATGNFLLHELLHVRWKVLGKHWSIREVIGNSII